MGNRCSRSAPAQTGGEGGGSDVSGADVPAISKASCGAMENGASEGGAEQEGRINERDTSSAPPAAGPAGHGDADDRAVVTDSVMDQEEEEEEFIDYDDHEAWELDDEDTFLMLKKNDPKLTMLDIQIGGNRVASRIDWDEEGGCLLQNNTHLKYLELRVLERNFLWEETEEEAAAREICTIKICRAIAKNRTIQHLRLDFDHTNVDMSLLEPFIAFNDKLRRISVSECTLDRKQADHFISALTRRRNKESIVRIDFCSNTFGQLNEDYHVVDGFGEAFSQAFMSLMATSGYSNLTQLDLPDGPTVAAYIQLSKLLANPWCKLSKVSLNPCAFDDQCIGILANAIAKNGSLKEISLAGMRSVGAGALSSFSAAFAGSGIEELSIRDGLPCGRSQTLCSEKAVVLGEMVANTRRLRVLRFSETMKCGSWELFFGALQNSAPEVLDISHCNVGEEGMASLGDVLASNSTLRVLEARGMKSAENPHNKKMNSRCWQRFFSNIGDAETIPIEKMDIGNSNVGDRGVVALSTVFANNNRLKTLMLYGSSISCAGVRALIGVLANNTALEHLDLGGNRIRDEGATALSAVLASNSTLKVLRLWGNDSITVSGRRSFLTILPNASLERLSLGGTVGVEEILDFVATLINDSTLKELKIGVGRWPRQQSNTLVSDALLRLLCDESSIEATFASNHALERLDVQYQLPDDIYAYLGMNSNGNKFQVARQKILQKHSDKGGSQAFIEMELEVLPRAIHWMAMDEDGLSLLFQLLRSLPALTVCRRSTKQTAGTKRKLGV